MLSDEQKRMIEYYKAKRQSYDRIAHMVKVSREQVVEHIATLPRKPRATPIGYVEPEAPTPEEIEAAIAPYREKQRRNPRYETDRGAYIPRHYCVVREIR